MRFLALDVAQLQCFLQLLQLFAKKTAISDPLFQAKTSFF